MDAPTALQSAIKEARELATSMAEPARIYESLAGGYVVVTESESKNVRFGIHVATLQPSARRQTVGIV